MRVVLPLDSYLPGLAKKVAAFLPCLQMCFCQQGAFSFGTEIDGGNLVSLLCQIDGVATIASAEIEDRVFVWDMIEKFGHTAVRLGAPRVGFVSVCFFEIV